MKVSIYNNLKFILVLMTLLFKSDSFVFCQDVEQIPIKLEREKTLVTVKIDNIVIPGILLDTGFPYDGIIIYNPAYLDSLNLSRAVPASLGGAGNDHDQNAMVIDSATFFMGKTAFINQRIILLKSDIYKGFPSNGIIGYSLFGHYAVEIDYDKSTLILHQFDTFKPEKGMAKISLYFKENMIPWVDIGVVIKNEKPVTISAYIDFADRDPLVILEKPVMKISILEGSEQKIIGTGLSGDIYGKTGRISKLIIDTFELNNVNVTIAPASARSKQKNADAVLGCGALNRFNIIFDFKNKYLYLRPNKSFNKRFQ